jgi:hypothetical protein
MAPEQARGEHVDARADVYAAAVLCWQLLTTGHATSSEMPQLVSGGALPSLATVRGDLPRELVAAIDAALEQDPEKRTITCAELSRWIAMVGELDEGKSALRAHVEAFAAAEEYEEVAPESIAPARPNRRRARALRRGSGLGARVLARGSSEGKLESAAPSEPPPIEEANEDPTASPDMPSGRAMTMMGMGPASRDALIRPPPEHPPAVPSPPVDAREREPSEIAESASPIDDATEIEPAPPSMRPRRPHTVVIALSVMLLLGSITAAIVSWRRTHTPPRFPTTSTSTSTSSSASTAATEETSSSVTSTSSATDVASSEPPIPSTSTSTSPSESESVSAKSPIPVPTIPIPKGWGWIVVHSDLARRVYVNGLPGGYVEAPIAWGCGPRSIAVANFDKYGRPVWMSKSQWFNVKCGSVITEVTIK